VEVNAAENSGGLKAWIVSPPSKQRCKHPVVPTVEDHPFATVNLPVSTQFPTPPFPPKYASLNTSAK
jgi:hypothetical protein